MSKRIKLEVWQQPLTFKDPNITTITKAEHKKLTKSLDHPLTWKKRAEKGTTVQAISKSETLGSGINSGIEVSQYGIV